MRLSLVLVTIIYLSCSSAPVEPYVLPRNAAELIAGSSSKTWKLAKRTNDGNRMNMGDCFLSYRQTFKSDMTVRDNNSEQKECGESLLAKWEIVQNEEGHSFIKLTSPQISALMNIEDDFKNFKILHLAEDKMKIAFYHRQFSDKWRTIVDYMVPEDVVVEDRDFHW